MKKLLALIFITLSLSLTPALGQNRHVIDSLKNELKEFDTYKKNELRHNATPLTDSFKVTLLTEIGRNYYPRKSDSGFLYYKQAIALADKIDYKRGSGDAYQSLGSVLAGSGRYPEAMMYFQRALVIRNGLKDAKGLIGTYRELAFNNAKVGNYKAAYDYELLFKQYYDSIYNKINENKMVRLHMQFDSDKNQIALSEETARKEVLIQAEQKNKDALAELKAQNLKNTANFLWGGIAIVIVFSGFVFFLFRNNQKLKKELEKAGQQPIHIEKLVEPEVELVESEVKKVDVVLPVTTKTQAPSNDVITFIELLIKKRPRPDQLKYLEAIRKLSGKPIDEPEHKIDYKSLNGMRILVADADELTRMIVKDSIELKAFVQVDQAADREQVIQQLEKHKYDVILTGIEMPVINGIETPVIALTKPFHTWQMFEAIAETVRKPILESGV